MVGERSEAITITSPELSIAVGFLKIKISFKIWNKKARNYNNVSSNRILPHGSPLVLGEDNVDVAE